MNNNYAIICSNLDKASVNIKDSLIQDFKFQETSVIFENEVVFQNGNISLYTVNKELIYCENINNKIDANYFIFASKHQSKTKIPSLTVHSIGNWGSADLGGIKNKLVLSSALLQRDLFINLNKISLEYEIINEATHHGPFLNKPSIFIEIGSTEKEWNNKETAKLIAKVIVETIKKEREIAKVAIGFGGLHTCTNFNKIIINNKVAIAHFCPKYALQYLNKEMIKESINKTIEKVDYILLDWKGLKDEKQRILNDIKELNIDYKKTSEF